MCKPEMLKDGKGCPVNKWHHQTANLPRAACARRRSCLAKGMAEAIIRQWSNAILGTAESETKAITTTTHKGITINIIINLTN